MYLDQSWLSGPVSKVSGPVPHRPIEQINECSRLYIVTFICHFSYNENRRIMDNGYPKYISDDFPGLNTTINAAIHKEGEINFKNRYISMHYNTAPISTFFAVLTCIIGVDIVQQRVVHSDGHQLLHHHLTCV